MTAAWLSQPDGCYLRVSDCGHAHLVPNLDGSWRARVWIDRVGMSRKQECVSLHSAKLFASRMLAAEHALIEEHNR